MTDVRLTSDVVPALLADPEAAWLAVRVATRVEAMGLLGTDLRRERMLDAIGDALSALVEAGIARGEVARLEGARPGDLASIVSRVADALEASPHPDSEWGAVTTRLGDDLVARLGHVSASSLARYASGVRATPDAVAARLHHLAMILADLAGSYNDRGIRRWFDRPRPQLAGAAPASLLEGDWDPDDEGPQAVARLAAGLAGAGCAT